jgi:hypothetical protein
VAIDQRLGGTDEKEAYVRANGFAGDGGKTWPALAFSTRAEKPLLGRSARRDLRKKFSPLTPYLYRCSDSTSKISLDKLDAS